MQGYCQLKKCSFGILPWTRDVKWTYIKQLEDAQDIFLTSYVRSVYVLCPGGRRAAHSSEDMQGINLVFLF